MPDLEKRPLSEAEIDRKIAKWPLLESSRKQFLRIFYRLALEEGSLIQSTTGTIRRVVAITLTEDKRPIWLVTEVLGDQTFSRKTVFSVDEVGIGHLKGKFELIDTLPDTLLEEDLHTVLEEEMLVQ